MATSQTRRMAWLGGALLGALSVAAGYGGWAWSRAPVVDGLSGAEPMWPRDALEACRRPLCRGGWLALKDAPPVVAEAIATALDPTLTLPGENARSAPALAARVAERYCRPTGPWQTVCEARIERDVEGLPYSRQAELHINSAEIVSGVHGIDALSRALFDTRAAHLGPREAALVAALVAEPAGEGFDEGGPTPRVLERAEALFELGRARYFPPRIDADAARACERPLDADMRRQLDRVRGELFDAIHPLAVEGRAYTLAENAVLGVLDEPDRRFARELLDALIEHGPLDPVACRLDADDLEAELAPLPTAGPRRRVLVPRAAMDDLLDLLEAARAAEIPLYVTSGYRSRGYQAYLLFMGLAQYGYCADELLAFMAAPGASEHHCLDSPAVDFGSEEPEEFEATRAYAWLQVHAERYGFSLSYPDDQGGPGIAFEPWHWRWQRPEESP